MKTALITGVTGQDGRYLAEHLARKGHRVVGTTRSLAASSAAGAAPCELREVPLEDGAAVAEIVRELRPDEIYHLAGQSSVGLSFAQPVETYRSIASTTLNVLDSVRLNHAAARVFVASSGEVFGDTGDTRATEATPFDPLSPYAAAKAAAAELARAYRASYGLFACVGFLYNHESPLRSERFVTRKIVRAACEIALRSRERVELGDVSVVRDWGWAPEYVDAMARMLEQAAPMDFVIATGESHPLSYFVEVVFRHVGLDWKAHVTSSPGLFRPAEARVLRANPAAASEKLGWRASVRLDAVAKKLVDHELAELERQSSHPSK